ncbi:hypothetical protein [Maribellus maritimus]|uniref:hypothetical protein n=1 Tax=Maribellus maritimus TaxID=2870838 RepID=UPI001EEADF0C|nr:hypothetical protein [Maribellus maritimus]MCG6186047.1 hypothetical protein [Maribellus maritimus]
MNVRGKIVMSVLAVFMVAAVSAQQFYNSVNPLTTASNTLNYKLTGNQYYFWPKYIGSVYLNEEWCHAKLELENGDIYEDVYVKLNTYLDEMIMYNERVGSVISLDKTIIHEFEMEQGYGTYGLFRKVNFDRIPKGYHYVNVLYDGSVKLYLWHKTEVVKRSLYKDEIHGGMRDSEYKHMLNYYIIFPDGSMNKVSLDRRSFLQLFPEQRRTLKRLFRRNKIHFYTATDLVQATKIIEEEIF